MPEIIYGAFALSKRIPQGFNGHIETDFVAIFETVGDGLGRIIDTNRHSFNKMNFDSFMKRAPGKFDNPNRQITDAGFPFPSFKSDPNLMWYLGCQVMKAQGGNKTYDTMRDPLSRLQKRKVFCDLTIWQPVEATTDSLKMTLSHQPCQVDTWNVNLIQFPGTKYTFFTNIVQQFLCNRYFTHCSITSSYIHM